MDITVDIGVRKLAYVPAPGCRYTPKKVVACAPKRDACGMTMTDRMNAAGWVPGIRGEPQGEYTAAEDALILARERSDEALSFEIHRTINAIRCRRWVLVAMQPTHSKTVRDVWVTVDKTV